MAPPSTKQERKNQRVEKGGQKQNFHQKKKNEMSQPIVKRFKGSSERASNEKVEKRYPGLLDRLVKDGLLVDTSENRDDDDKYFEKKLKIKKGKLPNSFKEDGLDYLLGPGMLSDSESEKSILEESIESDSNIEDSNDFDSNSDESTNSYLEEFESSIESVEESDEEKEEKTELIREQKKKYVPPQLRNQDNQEFIQMKRLLQGHLNRISESNFDPLSNAIEEIFLKYKRGEVIECLTDLILKFVADKSNLIDSFLLPYASLLNVLSCLMGKEIAALFLQKIVQKLLEDGLEERIEFNLISMICQLYNFQITSCTLIYDLIRLYISNLNERNVEVLLKILKTCGSLLRQDDPSSLKDIVQSINLSALATSQDKSFRFKFMLETISDLKNNRKKPSGFEDEISRFKKMIKNLLKKKSAVDFEPFRISLQDIQNIEKMGKWWLVGSAWTGKEAVVPLKNPSQTDSIAELANKNKMNTAIRKTIFTCLLSAEDCVDAFEKLNKLGLKDKQEREIPRVILHCCLQEKSYNPFYALVAQKFCDYSYSFKITFQFALWDFIKQISTCVDRRILNCAKFYAFLLSKNAMNITILRVISFDQLSEKLRLFLVNLFSSFLSQVDLKLLQTILTSLSSNSDFSALTEGVKFFFVTVLEKNCNDADLKGRIKIAKSYLSSQ